MLLQYVDHLPLARQTQEESIQGMCLLLTFLKEASYKA